MPKTVDRDRKAEAIGRAALRVFRGCGYHGTRMADIAAAADVGKGTLYEYFKDKADILRFLFEQYFVAFKAGSLRVMDGVSSPGMRLLALAEFALNHAAEWEDHCAVYVDYFGAARLGDERFFSLNEVYDEFGSILRSLLEEARKSGELAEEADPAAVAELLLSVFDGVVLHGVFADRRCARDALRDEALRLLLRGLLRLDSGLGRTRSCSATSS